MDQSSERPVASAPVPGLAPVPRPERKLRSLALVNSPLRLAREADSMPASWNTALAGLVGWLGVETASVPAPDAAAPVFAPWEAWSPVAFQNGGAAGLPEAQFIVSYGLDHSGPQSRGDTDVVLISPHPATCVAGEGDHEPLPGPGTLRAMIRAAVIEGRSRIAIICHARQRAALAAMRLADDRALVPEDRAFAILAIEEALPALIAPAAPWDAMIAMPDLRGIVFTLLSHTGGLRGPWPMLWHRRGVRRVTSEVSGEGSVRLPLDAPLLVQTLALTLHAAGRTRAALQLHEAWARLRARGVTTPARGSDAPYATALADAELIALLCGDADPCGRAPRAWQALKNQSAIISGSQMPPLRVISANIANR